MDKNRKLQRYDRKDYTQVVDFPVEIVGRDGVVRRYSFEDSVRLYQRRIASAKVRYDDHDVVDAEVRHCQRRIEQLRRSYFTRYGWSAIRATDGPDVLSGDLAGEVAAFLRRCIEPTDRDPEGLDFAYLDTGKQCSIYSVRRAGVAADSGPGSTSGDQYLLYVYRFDESHAPTAGDAFFEFLKVLKGVQRAGEAVEVLVAFHHTADCGLVLTGRAGAVGVRPIDGESDPSPMDLSWMDGGDERIDPLREGLALLRLGDRQEALGRFVEAYEENHYRRAAYVSAAIVADQIGDWEAAETAALMGSHYFPNDATFVFHAAVARLRRGELDGARAALERLDTAERSTFAIVLLLALIELRAGRLRRGRRYLAQARIEAEPAELDQISALRRVRALLAARTLLRGSAITLVGACLLAALGGWTWALLPAAIGLGALPVIDASWRRQFARLIAAPAGRGLRLATSGDAQVASGDALQ